MGLEFNSEQEQISSFFTAYRNDIDIYTEDESKDKVFYKKLFSRLLNGTDLNINDIYPLGSSDDVIEACKKDTDTERKKIYIVDGDIYIMFSPKQTIPNLYVLDSYCIENFIIDEEAVCNTLCNFIGTKELSDIKTLFKFDDLINEYKDSLISLFYYKALEKKHRGYFNLYSLPRYLNKKNELNVSEINKEIEEITTRLIQIGLSNDYIRIELETMEQNFPKNAETFLRIISGKDYLIHLMSCRAKKALSYNTGHNKESWKYNFAQYCNLDKLEHLKNTIKNIVK